ncbi:antibiotic biosynthesis monooxygenase [Gammaproteobacteria bacterium]|jgi:quinol monooxygenase YgiN|nr:antibiotic biosynthesis monooxygenase [Rhodospirillaceae bacterium]MBT6482649.1 antibiotic biosynthesis monooxygenase [Gammaproteobacteria bacterium]MBT7226200.1 antibiotic biosynthesis monooxygenase [Gammaproteobacteria bacterium]MDB3909491.1 antibiotic biosynthesis monooxygenase [Gammaproteobacteria bacterium]MDC3196273.1 antibiotic biosynthesis monooxygenase [Gammaproteobacteria bacterium]
MKNLVIVSFPAKTNTLDQVKELLKAALPDTRSFAGCISVSTYIEEASNTVHLIEDWETLDHQAKYLTWRVETGLLELLEPLLEGGAASLKAIICGPQHMDI